MTASPYASDAKIAEACAAIGADLIGQTEQTLLQQLVVAAAVGGGGSTPSATAWGDITGTLADQTDLQTALNAKLPLTGGALTGAISVPTAANQALASARANGFMFGASPATANEGFSAFNNGLLHYAQGVNVVYSDAVSFQFDSSVWLSWGTTSATSTQRTFLSGAQAAATLQIGKASATPIDQTFKGPNGSGTNIVGGDIRIAPGQSTGNATPATVVLQGTAAGSSGTTEQTLVDVLTINSATLVSIASGAALQLGNAAAAGAVVPTHTLTVRDSTGTTYRIPCLI